MEYEGKPKEKGLFEKGDLIESLDLNIGYESIQKLKDGWGFGAAAHPAIAK